MKKTVSLLWVCVLGMVFAMGARAQSVDCNSPTSVAPDGRTLSGSIPAVTTFWFSVAARGASSYAAEANYPTAADSAFPALNAFAPTDVQPGCSGSSSLSPRNIMQFDPVIPNGNRVSITAGSAMTILVSVTNSTMQARDFTVRVAETTLFNPLWSTFGGFETFYRLQNTTRDTLNVTLRLINDAGTTVATHNQMLAANSTAPTLFTGPGPAPGLGVANDQAGQAILTHDGPPGALQVDGFLGLFTATPVVLPIKIVPAREGVSISRLQPSGGGGGGAVNSVTAGDASITIGGTVSDPTVRVSDLGITTAKLADANVTPAKLSFTAGTVSSLTEGTGIDLNPNTITTTGSIAVNLGGTGSANTVARSDHTHAVAGASSTGVGSNALANNSGSSNTAAGFEALTANTTGFGNTAVGSIALTANMTGNSNTAVGGLALNANTTASNNTAVGASALSNNTASNNTSVGAFALGANTIGTNNTAMGEGSLETNTTGNSNTAVGRSALAANTAGGNTAVGASAMINNTTGSSNTAVGLVALLANTTGVANTALGVSALAGNTIGNSNTAVGNDALGTNSTGGGNTAVGRSTLANNTASDNTAVGHEALLANTTGTFNTAMGSSALTSNTTADDNTALGTNAMSSNVTGASNTAVGARALQGNITASSNTAVGGGALQSNVNGNSNTAVGDLALLNNLAGGNTAVGASALSSNTNGNNNTAVGNGALGFNINAANNTAVGALALDVNTSGGNNTALGANALGANTSGLSNIAVGVNALGANTSGLNNIAVGQDALLNSTGTNNIAVGAFAGVSATTGGNNIYIGNVGNAMESNTIRIGNQAVQTATFIAGIRGVTVANSVAVLIDAVNGQLGTISSTRRVKEDIRDMGEVSQRLLQLRPVTFRYRQPMADGSKPLQYGLIAEEVAEVMPELVVYDKDGQPQTVQYHVLPALLLNELQHQEAKLQQQQGEVAELRQLVAAQAAEVAELKATLRATLAQR